MTSLSGPARRAAPRPTLPPAARRPLALAAAALVGLALAGFARPATALHGWLIGFALAGGVPLGAVLLLLVHALTGGRWGEAHRPALLAAARATPLLPVLVLPLVLGCGLAYPWGADPAAAGPDVARWYLNGPALALRSLLGLGLAGGLGWRLARPGAGGRLGLLEAGLGLCLMVVFLNAAAYDWLLSLEPRFTSSAFGAQAIVAAMLSALCVAVLASPARPDDASWPDLGGLMLAMVLGESYLALMGVVVHWYGDLPGQAAWYLRRTEGGWVWLEVATVVLGAGLPLAALLFGAVRRDPVLLRVVAGFVLVGLGLQDVWLVSPGTEPLSAVAGIVAVAAVAGLLVATSRALAPREGESHGD